MRGPWRPAVAVLSGLALTLAACGDDGNDQELQARLAAERAPEFRAAQTTTVPVTQPDDDGAAPVATSTTSTITPTGVVVPVIALDNTFRPEIVEIAVGDEVLWENRGANEHNVLRVEGDGWGVEVDDFQPGDVYAHVFTEPGEFRYYCSIHGNEDVGMIGTVIVTG